MDIEERVSRRCYIICVRLIWLYISKRYGEIYSSFSLADLCLGFYWRLTVKRVIKRLVDCLGQDGTLNQTFTGIPGLNHSIKVKREFFVILLLSYSKVLN